VLWFLSEKSPMILNTKKKKNFHFLLFPAHEKMSSSSSSSPSAPDGSRRIQFFVF